MKERFFRFSRYSSLLVILILVSCSTISRFSQYAYIQTTSLKVDALSIMDLAKEDFSSHLNNVLEFQTNLQKLYEYEKNRPKNEITIRLWDKLLDPKGHLLGGFLTRWQLEEKLNEVFIVEVKKLVSEAFDLIAGLESNKIKSNEISE